MRQPYSGEEERSDATFRYPTEDVYKPSIKEPSEIGAPVLLSEIQQEVRRAIG